MKKLYEICYGKEPTEKELTLLEIQYQRLLDNGYTLKEAQKILIDNNLYIDDLEHKDSIIYTLDNTIYYHTELQILSKPGYYDPETGTIVKEPFYLEMKHRYTMNQLLNYYYNKLAVPSYFKDNKRDVGAFKHLISSYKFEKINVVDFLLYVIDYVSMKEVKVSNPLDLKNWAQETYEYLEQHIICNKINVVYREELV